MKPTNHKSSFLLRKRCKRLFIILALLFVAKTSVFAQTITYISGTPCLGSTLVMGFSGATATSWYTVPAAPAGAIVNNGDNTCTLTCSTTGSFTLYAAYAGGIASYSPTIISAPPAPTTVTVSAPTYAICGGGEVTFTATATGSSAPNVQYYWYINNNVSYYSNTNTLAFINGTSPQFALVSGNNTIRCVSSINAPCAPPPVTTTLTLFVGDFQVSPSTSICAGGSTTLTAVGGNYYSWSPATGLSATTGASVVASPAVTTTYVVTSTGCSTPKSVTITVNAPSALNGSPCAPPSGTGGGSFGGSSTRNSTPVILSGSSFSSITNVSNYNATDLVGFAYNATTGLWTQVPLQVDERKTIDAGTIYNTTTNRDSYSYNYGATSNYSNFSTIQYCDLNTWVGADTDPKFDADDELVFMARDAGGSLAPDAVSFPAGVSTAISGAQIKLTDPNSTGTAPSYVYIFKKSGSPVLDQAAGKSYVNYNFSFKVGSSGITAYGPADYKTYFNFGYDPETSIVSTPYYKTGFASRWIENYLQINIGSSATYNMIDRHRNQFSLSDCENEDSFTGNEGAFIINKSGPIRAIRSYMGAVSGPLTQREHYFYDQVEVIKTDLRVHNGLPGMLDFWDYNPAAGNMTYNNNNNATGVITVDGSMDSVTPGVLQWEMMGSGSGTVLRHYQLNTDISPFAVTSYYVDTNTPSTTSGDPTYQCPGGDNKAWGSSGLFITQNATYGGTSYAFLPMTDPRNTNTSLTYNGTTFQKAQLIVTSQFLSPATSRSQAPALNANLATALTAVVTKWPTNATTYALRTPQNNIDQVADADVINIYPNPSAGIFNVDAKAAIGKKILAIFYDSRGVEVYRTQSLSELKQTVNLPNKAGVGKIYIARFYIGDKVYSRKLLVNN